MNKILLNKIRNVRHYSVILNTMPGASYVEDSNSFRFVDFQNANISTCEYLGTICLADDSTREGFNILSRLLTETKSRQKQPKRPEI